jgi:fructose-bisphosphate aldolase class II
MPLATFKEILSDARRRKYAVGSFNIWDFYSAKGLITAAEKSRSPVIISLWQPELELAGYEELFGLCVSIGRSASVPVAIFLDHAKDILEIEKAIQLGATSIMIDGSHLSLKENVSLTSHAVEIARSAGVSTEAEIGILGEEFGSEPDEALYTDPQEAKRFVKETGVDALAVSIGNAHGYYKKEPKLDLNRLELIQSTVDVLLVLHGGSGLPPEDVQRAIEIGITKVNIGVEPRSVFMDGLRQSLLEGDKSEKFPHLIYPRAIELHQKYLQEKMHELHSSGKAS